MLHDRCQDLSAADEKTVVQHPLTHKHFAEITISVHLMTFSPLLWEQTFTHGPLWLRTWHAAFEGSPKGQRLATFLVPI